MRAMSTPAPSESGSGGVSSAEPWTVRRLLAWIEPHLAARGVDSPRLSAEILLAHVLDRDRVRLYMDVGYQPSARERDALRELVTRASKHEPIQYLVGAWSFYGRRFALSRATLIPRPATETVVETAVTWWRETRADGPLAMADIGTGTGAIAVSIVAEILAARRGKAGVRGCRPLGQTERDAGAAIDTSDVRCLATDLVPEALDVARGNAETHGVGANIEFRAGSLFEPLRQSPAVPPGGLDLLVSNPPYISDPEWKDVEPNVRDYEPATALRAGPDGLDVIRPLLSEAPEWLASGGLLLVEIAASQRDAALALLAARAGEWRDATVLKDLDGHWRVLRAERR
jgi:release factor glutamine methyltransferase